MGARTKQPEAATTKALLSVSEAAAIAGLSTRTAYREALAYRTVAGVPLVRTGAAGRGYKVPRARLLRALGLET